MGKINFKASKGYIKKNYVKYKKYWEEMDEFKEFLLRSPKNNDLAYCTLCEKDFAPVLNSVHRHFDSKYHRTKYNDRFNIVEELGSVESQTARTELKLTGLISTLNLPRSTMSALIPVLKNVITDSEIVKQMSLDRHRTGELMRRVLSPAHQEQFANKLRQERFSIIIDESTDISTDHCLGIMVRYHDRKYQKIKEVLWDLIQIYTEPNEIASAEHLTELIVQSFKLADVPIENISAFCADTCYLMMGAHNSVSSNLKEKIPAMFINKCNCHIQHLSAKSSYECLPEKLLTLLSSITNYICASPKRLNQWRWHQKASKVEPLRPIHPCLTRWLTVCNCVTYMLSRWTALKKIFRKQAYKKNLLHPATDIYNIILKPETKIYYQFLEFVLTKYNKKNAILQSIAPQVDTENSVMKNLLQDVLKCFINKDYIEQHIDHLDEINPKKESEWLHLHCLDKGKFAYESLFKYKLIKNEEERENVKNVS
ncbi:hypothetical protein TKK_0014021 [Trichogramma kaykai]|uniref:DUF4371 domain-containing protein n=1 Tax=Trichogramma kaykai TaxID=54128 RepID=A0ABD2WGU8_9HYME